jgi:hypothetical protein
MPIYRKKQIEVEAYQFTEETKDRVFSWARSIQSNIQHSWEGKPFESNPCLLVPTLEGEMTCSLGDYLIKEPFPTDWRKIYPCKPSIFEQTYEEVVPGSKLSEYNKRLSEGTTAKRFIITNNRKKSGSTIVKLYGSKNNAEAPNFGNDTGISISVKDGLYKQEILSEYNAGLFRIQVEEYDRKLPEFIFSENGKKYPSFTPLGQPAGFFDADILITPDVQIEFESPNGTETKVTIWPLI